MINSLIKKESIMTQKEVKLYKMETSQVLSRDEALVINFVSSIPGGCRSESVLALMGMWLQSKPINQQDTKIELEYELASLLDVAASFEFDLVGVNDLGEVLFRAHDTAHLEAEEEGFAGLISEEIITVDVLAKITAWSLDLLEVNTK